MPLLALLLALQAVGGAPDALPVLEFPDLGLDDPTAYQGYRTRLFWDAKGNAVQVYLDGRSGRVVMVWADAANESAGFTVRDSAGRPVTLEWGSPGAVTAASGTTRSIEIRLVARTPPLAMGHVLLGSMRKERDFQYQEGHLKPFDAPPFVESELLELLANLERLDPVERTRHLVALQTRSVADLRDRLQPRVSRGAGRGSQVVFEQRSFDGRNQLWLELAARDRRAVLEQDGRVTRAFAEPGRPLEIRVRVRTDAGALTPLRREEIFNAEFQRFYDSVRAAAPHTTRVRRLERQIRGVELLSYGEKLMAGLPNFATYFGRDMLMSALMMEPIWSVEMQEHVLASVLRKLSPAGEVSHEEALGGQAIRENVAEYNRLVAARRERSTRGDRKGADSALAAARALIGRLQTVRENYHMLDDDFQLPVLAGRYLGNPDVSPERKRAFLRTWLGPLLRNLAYVARAAAPYAERRVPENLVGFPRRGDGRWSSGSWRDSGPGYANGRFAMDINAVWVPEALRAMETILPALRDLGYAARDLERAAPVIRGSPLVVYARDLEALGRARERWEGAVRHFQVGLGPAGVRERLGAKLGSLPADERRYWERLVAETGADQDSLAFLALALDAGGRPIPVVHTDPATLLFLVDLTAGVAGGAVTPADLDVLLEPFRRPYPVGLFVEGLGPLVANDAYAGPDVWERFQADPYHAPRVVWGREVNLLLLGLARRVAAAYDSTGELRSPRLEPYVRTLGGLLGQTLAAVEASGFRHAELWSYQIAGGVLRPVRYGTSSDVQLWSLTDLAVQFALSRTPGLEPRP